MNKLPMLIQREFWENRSTFLILPGAITGFMVLLMLLASLLSGADFVDIDIEFEERTPHSVHRLQTDNVFSYMVVELEDRTERGRGKALNSGLHGLASPLLVTMWFVIVFYLLDCLYSDRKDRSILFWKSLPVSDAMTVAAKLLTALIAIPLVYFVAIAVLHVAALLFLTFATFGTEYSAWEVIWKPAPLFASWGIYFSMVLFYAVWALPFFAWLMAVSAFARSAPLMWAVGVPIVIVVLERMLSDRYLIAGWIVDHLVPVNYVIEHHSISEFILERLASLQMLSALVVGGLLLFTATWLRSRADEI